VNRRHALLAGGAAVGATALGWIVWRMGAAGGEEEPALWSLRFDAPDGRQVAMSDFRGRPLVINFWATWCPPCVREMPTLDRFQRDLATRGWVVMGIAADNPEPVREFLKHTPVSFPIGLAGFAGVDLARQLGNTSGGLPFTVVLDRRGRIRQRHSGETQYDQLRIWAEGIS
jgi:thiol-disulfide isomerase/thioredoxin